MPLSEQCDKLPTVCEEKLIGEDGEEFLGYLGKVGTYYRVLTTCHTLASQPFINGPFFTQFKVEVVPHDYLKGHAVTTSSANPFQDLKTNCLDLTNNHYFSVGLRSSSSLSIIPGCGS